MEVRCHKAKKFFFARTHSADLLSCINLAGGSHIAERQGLESAKAVIVSADSVRPISDQCELLLKQLHKLIFITQLPPPPRRDNRRLCIERYKRELFSGQGGLGWDLKAELCMLLHGSERVIDLDFPSLLASGLGGFSMFHRE